MISSLGIVVWSSFVTSTLVTCTDIAFSGCCLVTLHLHRYHRNNPNNLLGAMCAIVTINAMGSDLVVAASVFGMHRSLVVHGSNDVNGGTAIDHSSALGYVV